MSYISSSSPTFQAQKPEGNYTISNISAKPCYGIFLKCTKTTGNGTASGWESGLLEAASGATTYDGINQGLYSSVNIKSFLLNSTTDPVKYWIYSVPLRYIITYHQNNDGTGSTKTVFTDDPNAGTLCNCSSTPSAGDPCYIPDACDICSRRDSYQTGGGATIYYETDIYTYTGQELGWTIPSGTFIGWTTTQGGTTPDITIQEIAQSTLYEQLIYGLCNVTTERHLYPVITPEAQYNINVYFDTNEINNISVSDISQVS